MSPQAPRTEKVDLGRQHLPPHGTRTPARRPAWMANITPVVPTPPIPSPVIRRDVNTNTTVENAQQRGHNLPLARSRNANLRAEEQQRLSTSPLGRLNGGNASLNVENRQRSLPSSSSGHLHSSSSNKKVKKVNENGNKQRERCGRCKHPLDHVGNADDSGAIKESEEKDDDGEGDRDEGDDVAEGDVGSERSDESDLCECYEREQLEMENGRNSWVEGEDPHQHSDEEEFLSWLQDWNLDKN